MQSVLKSFSLPPSSLSASPQAGHDRLILFCCIFDTAVFLEADPRARQAADRDMEQEHPAEPVYPLIEHAVICNALYKVEVREVPHAPVARERAAEMDYEERRRSEHARDRADQRGGKSPAAREEQRDDRQNVHLRFSTHSEIGIEYPQLSA